MSAHISAVCRTGFFQLCQLRTIRRSLTPDSARALVQAFVSCRLDYCNSLFACVADVHLHRLQSVQNMAAHLVSGACRHDHITPILATLHWLPVRERVTFKTAALVWKYLHDVAPHYLVDLCVPTAATAGHRQSHSAVSGALMVPWTRTSIGQRSFAVYGPNLEPITASPSTARTVAIFIQAPAQDPPLPALVGCSCASYIPPSGAAATVVSSAPIINVPTQLNSTRVCGYTSDP